MTGIEFPAPAEWSERIEAYLTGAVAAQPARLASTVVLLREPEGGSASSPPPSPAPEIYLLKRATTMSFAGGRYAFPGGRVDPADSDASIGWAGPAPEEWAARFSCSAADARALVSAVVRETFEETGILFAGPSPTSVVTSTVGEDWEEERRALETRELSLTELLGRRSLVLRTDLLRAWARWITPEFEPRRYDTAFFIAALPPGQQARDVSGEADGTLWTPAARAVADHLAGTVSMLPPTVSTLRGLAGYPSAAAALDAASERSFTPITPQVERHADGGFRLVYAADAG
jgi:8-oxo-dGTP pyrophosphatase MutT (NUDIX family)